MQRLILNRGVEPERAAEVLRSLALGAREARVAGHEWYQVRDAYLHWVERVESQLPALTSDLALIAAVQTEHYWRLQDAAAKFARPNPMITAELDRQHDRFDALARELERRRDHLAKAPGAIAVVDTNVLLHYQPPEHVIWTEIVGATPCVWSFRFVL